MRPDAVVVDIRMPPTNSDEGLRVTAFWDQARCLWDALPDEYRAGAIVFSDFWAAYAAVVPESQHIRCGKGDGMTNHVERFWCTVRQRCGRFVRKTLSFSRCDTNHIARGTF